MAPTRWSSSSSALPSATSIAMLSMLRILRGSPGRVHTMPQADLVASICMGIVSSSAFLSCLSTYSAPSTCLRSFSPCSNNLSLIAMLPMTAIPGGSRSIIPLFRLDPRLAHEPALFFEFRFDVRGELLRRGARLQLDAALEETVVQIRRAHRVCNSPIQPHQDLARGSRRRHEAVEGDVLVARHARLIEGGHLGKKWRAPETRDRERPQLPRPDLRCRGAYLVEHHRDLSADDIHDCLGISLVRNVQHLHAG